MPTPFDSRRRPCNTAPSAPQARSAIRLDVSRRPRTRTSPPPVTPGAGSLASTLRRSYPTFTWIVRGFASSRFGSTTVRTPFSYFASTFDPSTVEGSENDR